MGEVLDAEIIKEEKLSLIKNNPFISNLDTNKKLGILISTIIIVGLIIISTIWSGAGPGGFSDSKYEWWEVPLEKRHLMDWDK